MIGLIACTVMLMQLCLGLKQQHLGLEGTGTVLNWVQSFKFFGRLLFNMSSRSANQQYGTAGGVFHFAARSRQGLALVHAAAKNALVAK